jgi:N-acetylglucosamine-6-sulfatase
VDRGDLARVHSALRPQIPASDLTRLSTRPVARRAALVAGVVLVEAALLSWLWLRGGGLEPKAAPVPFTAAAHHKPNPPTVLFILTDDQRWDALGYMPIVHREIAARGVTFANAFVSNSLCCPSRSSILTGDYSHTTRVYREIPPYGRFEWLDDRSTVATWLHGAGYHTGLFGKYIDGYQIPGLKGYVPPGWDRWVAFLHSAYYGYRLSIDGTVHTPDDEPKDYSTSVLTHQAVSFIRGTKGPLFVYFAPAAPHAPAIPAPRDVDAFAKMKPWRPPSYDEADVSDKPQYIRSIRRFIPARVGAEDAFRRDQYASLLSVDRSVGKLLHALAHTGRLSNTLIIYTTDNGISWGEHRWVKKEVPYEEGIRVPLVIRYDPMITAPRTDHHLVLNIDFAPTIADVTGVGRPTVDGRSIVPLLRSPQAPWRHDFLIEHMRGTNDVPTYCGVRNERYVYVRYATGEEELYDLRRDPYELSNVARDPASAAPLDVLRPRLGELCDPPPPGYAGRSRAVPVAATIALPLATVVAGIMITRKRRRRPG